MGSRYRKRPTQTDSAPPADQASPPGPDTPAEDRKTRLLVAVAIAAFLALFGWMIYQWRAGQSEPLEPVAQTNEPPRKDPKGANPRQQLLDALNPKLKDSKGANAGVGENFLETFGKEKPGAEEDGPAPTGAELEAHFQQLDALREQVKELANRDDKNNNAEGERLMSRYNKELADFEKEVGRARAARPADPIAQWLTGELLLLIGGDPRVIVPYLQQPAAAGLDRPRLFASMARAQTDSNQFAPAYDSARKAVEQAPLDRYAWNAFARAAFNLERFAEVAERLDQSYPGKKPDWVVDIRREGLMQQVHWDAEQKLRRAEAKANDLPRVRLVVEHRRFVRGRDGKLLPTSEAIGKGEVVVEFFEDQAPKTVANFLDLVGRKFYDGTRFHLAAPATLVTGGDPNTKNDDPSDDGSGGPGYTIPDEFREPGARRHFRGALSMVNTDPGTAGSQFFLTVAPMPLMDGQFTVFGRVIQGQEVVDRITLGRTTPEVGRFGKIIPGDVLVHAEVIRKRPHEYRVIKLAR